MNKKTIQKINILFIPLLITSIGFCTIYTFLNWLLFIKLELFSINESIVEFGIPFFLPVIPVIFFFRPRLKILNLKKSNGKTYNELYLFILWLSIAGSAVIAQDYLKNSTGKLVQIESVSQIPQKKQSKYYKVNRFYFDKSVAGTYTSFDVSNKGNDFNMTLFVVIPIFDKKNNSSNLSCKYWLGIKYYDQISNRSSEKEKQDRYEQFLEISQSEFDRADLSNFIYLERIGNSDDGDSYKKALKNCKKFETENSIIFISKNQPFESRKGNTIYWLIGTLSAGAVVWLIMILIPKLNQTELSRFKNGTSRDKDLNDFLNFMKPREGFFITPILIYVNVLIYITMAIAGLGFISFHGEDLLRWGGNFRPSTIDGQWWRLLTSVFLHSGFIHLLSNMFGLLFVGIFIEPILGKTRYLILYLSTGILASCASIWWHEATVSIGASGAIFGLYGTFLALLLAKVFPPEFSKAFLITTLIFVAYNLIMGLAGGIDNAAHIGGLLSGFIIGIEINKPVKDKMLNK
ncbi:rhomboid family intramembrane serine protease [Flavobacterium ustbae]|uniref:rhomboid family intramembrane serine protease n=1 Tax=Flavobacterium ustbae TaxID=2488790 RepID=UPI0013DE74AE|nr:rhomboid family intramembrane serine protease [Flavobacterium ustbae]